MLSSEERGNAWTDMYTAALYIDADWNVDGEDHYYAGVTERLRADHEALTAERDERKRIAEWLARRLSLDGAPTPLAANFTLFVEGETSVPKWLEAAREAVSSPATTTTKEEGL